MHENLGFVPSLFIPSHTIVIPLLPRSLRIATRKPESKDNSNYAEINRDQAVKKSLLLDRPAKLLQVLVVRNILIHGGTDDLLRLRTVLVEPVLVFRLDS